ncbi:MAG: epoxyqueuosine reductase [Desulfobacteraceae bacterium]|nr:epoxyqueuosine reductase [Desulfobacteraceae bacterium]
MNDKELLKASSAILKKAKEFGASLAGFANVEELKKAPSFTFAPKMPGAGEGVGTRKNDLGLKPGEAAWPENAKTVLVIAVEHPDDKPEMDWWFGRIDPPGNRVLADVIKKLCIWIAETYGIGVFHLPYHVEKGGTYLKDSAVLAGLGCIGKINILVTPEYGPRVRLRALTMDVSLPSTGPTGFDPCAYCDEYCRKACPQHSFENRRYDPKDYGQDILPGRDGSFSRPNCNIQMDKDNENAIEEMVEGSDKPVKLIKYCRRCEHACPVGKS